MSEERDFPGIILLLLVIIFLVIVSMFVVNDIKEDIRHLTDRVTVIESNGEHGKR